MDKALYISQYHEEYLDQLKMALLYFDQLEIPLYNQQLGYQISPDSNRVRVYNQKYFISEDFQTHIEPLIEKNIILYKKIEYDGYRDGKPIDHINGNVDPIAAFILKNISLLYKNVSIKKDGETLVYEGDILDELIPLQKYLQESIQNSSGLLGYATRQLTTLINALSDNDVCLTTGDFLHNLLSSYVNSKRFNEFSNKSKLRKEIDAAIAFNAIKLAIPNISSLSFEQIVDLRIKLKDELMAFKIEVERVRLELEFNTPLQEIYLKSEDVVKVKIQPVLNDLINKMKSITVYKGLLDSIKDPKSYSPLLLSFTNNFSNTQVLLSSLGLISFSTALDFYEKNRNLKANGHYYLLKLNRLK